MVESKPQDYNDFCVRTQNVRGQSFAIDSRLFVEDKKERIEVETRPLLGSKREEKWNKHFLNSREGKEGGIKRKEKARKSNFPDHWSIFYTKTLEGESRFQMLGKSVLNA
jgi:hypothetical protein